MNTHAQCRGQNIKTVQKIVRIINCQSVLSETKFKLLKKDKRYYRKIESLLLY
jgi:hypothetical protein